MGIRFNALLAKPADNSPVPRHEFLGANSVMRNMFLDITTFLAISPSVHEELDCRAIVRALKDQFGLGAAANGVRRSSL